jgi:hypothetical protein
MAVRFGVEHEYHLTSPTGSVDFRLLLPLVAQGLATLDPSDPRARRLPSGTALTADGFEAELATPPLPLGPDLTARLDDLLAAERSELAAALVPHGVTRIAGFSTHFNISVPDDRVVEVGRRFVNVCVGALADAVEPVGSSGVFVRPRRGRLEVGTEYTEGPWLEAGCVLLASCVAGLQTTNALATQAPDSVPSREKFGWYVESPGRGELARIWSWARPFAAAQGLPLRVLDELATGDRLLRRDQQADPSTVTLRSSGPAAPLRDLTPRTRPDGIRAHTEWVTWDWVVWRLEGPDGAVCRTVVPATDEDSFLCLLDAGALDAQVARTLRARHRRHLVVNAQISRPTQTWWHDLRPGALVPAERRPTDGSVPRVSRRQGRRELRLIGRSAA